MKDLKKKEMGMEIEIVELLKKVKKIRMILLSTLLFYPVFGLIVEPTPFSFIGIFSSSLFIINVIFIYYYYHAAKRYVVNDYLYLSEEIIQFTGNILKLSDIKSIAFRFVGYEGDSYWFDPSGLGMFGEKDGAGNSISIQTNNGEMYNFNVVIRSDIQRKNIKAILNLYKESVVGVNWIKCNIFCFS